MCLNVCLSAEVRPFVRAEGHFHSIPVHVDRKTTGSLDSVFQTFLHNNEAGFHLPVLLMYNGQAA